MSRVNTNKKLELVRAIRMQNHYNRQLFRSREGILNSGLPEEKRAELYGLEAEGNSLSAGKESAVGKSFRFRFVIAMALLLFFILCDINHLSYGGETTDSLYGRITSSPELWDFFEGGINKYLP